MYNNKASKLQKKRIEIAILVVVVLWISLFIIDYVRYKDSKHPLITIKHKTVSFEDGVVEEYRSLGWTYREYKRRAIGDIELTPFWKKMQRPAALNTLPVTKKDYEVPENPDRLDEYKGLVYFFDYGGGVMGTYKCLNTETGCFKAISGIDEYDIKNIDIATALTEQPKFDSYEFKYAWIDDSVKQNASSDNVKQYQRTIYLFDIEKNEILGEFKNIKYSTINNKGRAEGYLGTYIVQDKDNKWGVVKVTAAGPQTVVDFEFDSVNYNENTKTYIVKKDGLWYLYNQDSKEYSNGFEDPITEAIQGGGEIFIKTVKQEYIGTDKYNNYYLSKLDGTKVVNEANVVSMVVEQNFIMYLTYNRQIKVIDYQGNQKIKETILTNFIPSNKTQDERSPFDINIYVNNDVKIYIPLTNDKQSTCDTYYYSNTWELKTQKNESCK